MNNEQGNPAKLSCLLLIFLSANTCRHRRYCRRFTF